MDHQQTFQALVREHGPLIARIAASYEADREVARDLTQEILLAVWRAVPTFREQTSWRTYIARIAHNRSFTPLEDELRGKSNRLRADDLDELRYRIDGIKDLTPTVMASQRFGASRIFRCLRCPGGPSQAPAASPRSLEWVSEYCLPATQRTSRRSKRFVTSDHVVMKIFCA